MTLIYIFFYVHENVLHVSLQVRAYAKIRFLYLHDLKACKLRNLCAYTSSLRILDMLPTNICQRLPALNALYDPVSGLNIHF